MSARLFAVRATNHTFPLPVLEHTGRRHPVLRQRKKKRLPPSGQYCSFSSQIHSSRNLNQNRSRKRRRRRRRNILTTITPPPDINPTTGALSWTSTPVRGVGGSVVNLRMGELVQYLPIISSQRILCQNIQPLICQPRPCTVTVTTGTQVTVVMRPMIYLVTEVPPANHTAKILLKFRIFIYFHNQNRWKKSLNFLYFFKKKRKKLLEGKFLFRNY